MLIVERLSAGYGETEVLTNVSIRIGRGEIVAIVGANGAGKSTLLRTIMGSLRMRTGSARFDNISLAGRAPYRIAGLGIRLVPEGRRIFPNLSVEENLLTGVYLGRQASRAAALDRVFALFPILAERRNHQAATLSGGQQQMLALGRALAGEPRLLMLDEPSLGLAPRVIEEIFSTLSELRSSEIGILLVEQNARKALAVADRAYVLENGQVTLEGPAPELAANRAIVDAYLGGHA
ncbi:MAG: ABC transporter ATP-binding protein [Burkholderiales bacterium]|nr:ABC transporter ATP-binding protein [Burkholderiales bacterium]